MQSVRAAEKLTGSQRQAGMNDTDDMIADQNLMIDASARLHVSFPEFYQAADDLRKEFLLAAANFSQLAWRRAARQEDVKWIASWAIRPSPIRATANQYGA